MERNLPDFGSIDFNSAGGGASFKLLSLEEVEQTQSIDIAWEHSTGTQRRLFPEKYLKFGQENACGHSLIGIRLKRILRVIGHYNLQQVQLERELLSSTFFINGKVYTLKELEREAKTGSYLKSLVRDVQERGVQMVVRSCVTTYHPFTDIDKVIQFGELPPALQAYKNQQSLEWYYGNSDSPREEDYTQLYTKADLNREIVRKII